MGIPMRALLVVAMVVLSATVVVAFDGYDGLPRPSGMDQAPTTTYGAKPAVKYDNKPANCIWYGWENGNYPPAGTKNCSSMLWESLSAANPEGLSGFMYYVPLETIYFDPLYNEYLCAIGCFDLTASGPSEGPAEPPTVDGPAVNPPPPAAAPPVADAPPPVAATSPPGPPFTAPPPATLFRPPPPATPLPPAPTPVTIVVPPSESAPSPAIASPGFSPESAPISTPGSGPVASPGPFSSEPSVVQASSATSTSASTAVAFTATLFLFIQFVV